MVVVRNSRCSDGYLNEPGDVCSDADVIQQCDACLITVPSTVEYGHHHGVCKLDSSVRCIGFMVNAVISREQ